MAGFFIDNLFFTTKYRLEMTLKTFVKLPLVRLSIHVILIVGIALNVLQFFRISRAQQVVAEKELALALLEDLNSESQSQKGYYTSSLYEEIYAKQKQYKVRDEQVLDTQNLEGENDVLSGEYIPPEDLETAQESNPEKWFKYLTRYAD